MTTTTDCSGMIAPAYRTQPHAAEWGRELARRLSWSASDFGSGYAWEADIPAWETWDDEIAALEAHLRSLGG